MSITHSFIDFIPSILFGVPNPDTTLSILPGHKMVYSGEAYYAIFLSSLGSLSGCFFSILIIPLFILFITHFYESFKIIIPYLLGIVSILFIIIEKGHSKKFWSSIILLFSGGQGLLLLNSDIISNPLLIIFSGIFGVAALINTFFEELTQLPKQKYKFKFKFSKDFFKSMVIGTVSSSLCSITPGIGNSQAAVLSSLLMKDISSKLFIVVLSSINTINFILSIITFYLIERARNGSIIAISQLKDTITLENVIFYFIIIILTCILAFFITLLIGKRIIKLVEKVNILKINFTIILFIFIIVFFFDSFYGILALIFTTILGLLCILLDVKRIHLMNVLIIPVILNLI